MRRLHGLVWVVALALFLGACTTTGSPGTAPAPGGSDQPAAGAFPVTIEHALGRTTIERQPTRVVTLGWADADVALALGTVPIGATKITWGGNAAGSTPWFDAELARQGGQQPTRYSDSDGAPVDELAALGPDLILATNTAITPEEYAQLSKIAPVIAYPGVAWGTSWQDSLTLVGRALGKSEQAAALTQRTEAAIADAAAKNRRIKDKTFIFGSLSATDKSKIDYYTTTDNRVRLLTEVGMKPAPIVEQNSAGSEFFRTVSAEQASTLQADVFITYTMQAGELETFRQDPLLSKIPAFATGGYVDATNQTDVLGMSAPSPLSIPWTMERFIPLIDQAVEHTES